MGMGLFRLYTQLAEELSSSKMRFVGQAIAAASLSIERTATDAVALQETPRTRMNR